MYLTNNFELSEFTKGFDGQPSTVQMNNIQKLADNLQVLREHLSKPIILNSGLRSFEHNEAVGGVKKSRHLYGQAADFRINGMEPKQIADIIEDLISKGTMQEGGVGIYDTWVHYDVRGFKARWDNRKKKVN